MTYTYTEDQAAPYRNDVAQDSVDAPFVPAYARKSAKTKKVKTWMILAPIAGVALIGGAAAMLMNGSEPTAPLAEPAPAPVAQPLVQPMVATPAPVASTPAPVDSAPVAQPAPAPVARAAEPVRRAAPTPARRAAPAPTTRVEGPAEPTGPRAYSASPSTGATVTPRVTPAPATPAPTAPAPAITVQPLN